MEAIPNSGWSTPGLYHKSKPMKKYKYWIGIDTGVNTGMCIWDSQIKKIIALETMGILEAQAFLSGFFIKDKSQFFLRLEDARLRKWIPHQKTEKAERGRREGAGSVKRDTQIWEDFCQMQGIDYELVPPKNNKTKVTAEYFRMITKWQDKTNEHARDAAMLVFGK